MTDCSIREKDRLRAEIAEHIKDFKKRGGKIIKLKPMERVEPKAKFTDSIKGF